MLFEPYRGQQNHSWQVYRKRHITRISIWFVSVAAQMSFKKDLGYVHQVQVAAFVALRSLDDNQPPRCLSRLLL